MFKETAEVLDAAFAFYDEMRAGGVPTEDARFHLPLYTRTNIQSKGDARELMHLHSMSRTEWMPSIIRETVGDMMDQLEKKYPLLFTERAASYETLAWLPAAQLFYPENGTIKKIAEENEKPDFKTGEPALVTMLDRADALPLDEIALAKAVWERDEAELANLKHVHYTFLVKMSMAAFHQAIRQRTWDQSVESIDDAARRRNVKLPTSIEKSDFAEAYEKINRDMLKLYTDLYCTDGFPQQEAIGVLPHSLMVYDLVHVNGWNAIHAIGKRTCTKAQWEIREIANLMAEKMRESNPELGTYVQPQGVNYGKCPERGPCGYCDQILRKMNLE